MNHRPYNMSESVVRESPASATPLRFHKPVAPLPGDAEWPVARVEALLAPPFMALVQQAHAVHRAHFPRGDIELASVLSVKTGGCPEDCALPVTSQSPA
jgi:biotin synthase